MCIDCQDYLCQTCYNGHRIAKPLRNHELLDKEAMSKSTISKTNDECSEKCLVHEGEFMKYFCINHCRLCCNVCITLDHRSCDKVTYIPNAAKDLPNNEEYKQAESQLESMVNRSKKVHTDNKDKSESLDKACSGAVKIIQEFRKEINETLDKVEADILQKCETLKSKETEKLRSISKNVQELQRELQTLTTQIDSYQQNKQNCKLYTAMMKTKDTIKVLKDKVVELEKIHSSINTKITFYTNKETLSTLKHPRALERLSQIESDKPEYIQDINVKSGNDRMTHTVAGLAILPDNRLVISLIQNRLAYFRKKLVYVKHDQIITDLTLCVNDVATVTDSQVAVTSSHEKKIIIVTVGESSLTIDRRLDVNGNCIGVDYRDGKLAVSFINPDKVEVLTLQGIVLHTIQKRNANRVFNFFPERLFSFPYYLTFSNDNSSLYVSNAGCDNVLHVKFDGTVIGTYKDEKLKMPKGIVTGRNGNVYVCGKNSVHQITPEDGKIQEILTKADGIVCPYSITYCETENRLYVGTPCDKGVKVYTVNPESK